MWETKFREINLIKTSTIIHVDQEKIWHPLQLETYLRMYEQWDFDIVSIAKDKRDIHIIFFLQYFSA